MRKDNIPLALAACQQLSSIYVALVLIGVNACGKGIHGCRDALPTLTDVHAFAQFSHNRVHSKEWVYPALMK